MESVQLFFNYRVVFCFVFNKRSLWQLFCDCFCLSSRRLIEFLFHVELCDSFMFFALI